MSGDPNKSIRDLIDRFRLYADHKEDLARRYIKEISLNELEVSKQLWESSILQERATEIEEAIDSKGDPKKEIHGLIEVWDRISEYKDKMPENTRKGGIRPHEEDRLRPIWQAEMTKVCAKYLEEIINNYDDNQESED